MKRERLYTSGLAVPMLLMLAALSVALSLYEAEWGPGLAMLPWLVLASVALAVVLVRSVLATWVLHLVSLVVGFMLTVFLAGHYMVPGSGLNEAAQFVLARMGRWLLAAQQGLPTDDPLPFSFLLGLCLWMAFHYSTWLIYRSGRVWWAVVGPAIALLVNTYYAPRLNAGYVVVYAFCALLLIVRVSLQGLTYDWRQAHIPHDRTMSEEFLLDAAYIVVAVLIVSWVLPPLTLEQKAANLWVRFERPWRTFQQRWAELFPTTASDHSSPQMTVYGDSLAMGGPVQLAPEPLFLVQMSEPLRLQAMIYDLYDGRQWWSSASTIALVEPNGFPTMQAFQERRIIQQTVQVLRETRSLLAAPSPVWFSVSVKSEHLAFPVENGLLALDIYGAIARRTLVAGESYQAISAVSSAAKDVLRQAGNDYPSWLPRVYLDLPPSVPSRVAALAQDITQGLESPYDQAEALETYLRRLHYNQNVAAPPAGRDAADYFLFDSREGYCNYFASAMVLMARSLGIPARVAAGYAPGEYNSETGAYTILGSDAHSWPQLYFPGYGWIDFEPTPSQAVIHRPETLLPDEESTAPDTTAQPRNLDDMMDENMDLLGGNSGNAGLPLPSNSRLPMALVVVIGIIVVSAASFLLVWVLPRRSWTTAERLYANLIALARLLGVSPWFHETPAEHGVRLARALPEVGEEVNAIVQAFYQARYRQVRNCDDLEAGTALREAWSKVLRASGKALPRRLAYPSRPVT